MSQSIKKTKLSLGLVPYFVIAAVALLLRLLWIWNVQTEQLYDFSTYYEIAVNVYSGKGYSFLGNPIAFQGMGYSYLLGLYFKLVGSSTELTAKYFNVFLSMITLFASGYMVSRLSKRPLVRYGTFLFVALLPHHIAYCNAIGTEVFSAALLAVTLALQVSSVPKGIKWPLLGLMTGTMSLTKPFFMAYPLALGLYEWFSTKNIRQSIAALLIGFVCMWALVMPWTFRNYKYFHRFIPVSYNSGLVLYLNSNASNVHGGYMPLSDIEKTPELEAKINEHLNGGQKSLKLASDIELDLKPAAVEWIKKHPVEFFKLGFIRVHSTFFNGSWDIDAWTMNGNSKEREEKAKVVATLSEEALKEQKKADILYQRQMAFFRAVNDTTQAILTSFGCVFVLANLPNFFRALFSRHRKLLPSVSVPMLNIAFIVAVCFVYEGQPRYNFPILFLLAYTTMEVVALIVDYGKRQSASEENNL